VRMNELGVHRHEHVVAPTPLRDLALIIAGAHPDQGLYQPVPLRGPADPPIQDHLLTTGRPSGSSGSGWPALCRVVSTTSRNQLSAADDPLE